MLLILPALVVVLIIRALRPFILIRFAPLNSDRIGPFAGYTELYLCERDLGMHKNKALDLFYYTFPICNQQLKKMLRPYLHILKFPHFANLIYKVNEYLLGGSEHKVPLCWYIRDLNNLREHTLVHLRFSSEEERFGLKEKFKIGISDGVPFICFQTRDPVYLSAIHSENNFSYHNYRDASINTFMLSADKMTSRGYYMVRMGALVKERLITNNSRVIDYAVKYRTDFLDIYLLAKCHFFLCNTTGLAEIAMNFRRPICWVHFLPYEYPISWYKDGLVIFKKLYLRKEKRFLTFREILSSGVAKFFQTQDYMALGIDIIDNTPEEILDLAVEMDERINGFWKITKDDEELQQRFWSFFKDNPVHGEIKTRVGREFLRQNRELLN